MGTSMPDTIITLIYHPIFSRWVTNIPTLPPALCAPPYPLPSNKKYSKLFSPALILSAPCASSALCTPQKDCWSKPGKILKISDPHWKRQQPHAVHNTYIHACTHVHHTHTPPSTSHTHTNIQTHTETTRTHTHAHIETTHTHKQHTHTHNTHSPPPPTPPPPPPPPHPHKQPTNITSALQRSAVPKIGNFCGSHGACRWCWYQGRLWGWFTATANATQTLH